MKKVLFLIFLLCSISFFAVAQDDEDEDIPPPTLEEYKVEAIKKANILGAYIRRIVSINFSDDIRNKSIDLACSLFAEVVNGNQPTIQAQADEIVSYSPPKRYFDFIRSMAYKSVIIEWYEVGPISELRLQDDGKYYGTISIMQRFEGITRENIRHRSEVSKTITIILEKMKIDDEMQKEKWIIRFGDMLVTNNG